MFRSGIISSTGVAGSGGGGGSDADADAFLAAAGISDATISGAITQLCLDLKSASIWTKFTAIYPFVGGAESTHKYNLKDPNDTDGAFRLTFSGGWSHSSTGATPNGTTGYANTYINALNDLDFHDVSLSVYFGTDTGVGNKCWSGIHDHGLGDPGWQHMGHVDYFGGDKYLADTGDFGSARLYADLTGGTILDSILTTSKIGAGANNHNLYQDGALLGSISSDSGGFPNDTVYIGALHTVGAGSESGTFDDNEYRFIAFGLGLNSTEAGDLSTAVHTFQSTLGR